MDILKTAGALILCYLAGGVLFCDLISRSVGKKDLRNIGDKNPGGWNLAFNVSRYWGLLGMWLDALKGFLSYFGVLLLTNSELLAIIGGCLAVLGHTYSPYYRFRGGKGIGPTFGLYFGMSLWSVPFFGIGFAGALFFIRNMLWGVFFGIVTPMLFLIFFLDSAEYLALLLLIPIVIPRYYNYSKSFSENFRFRKEKSMKDLFTPRIR